MRNGSGTHRATGLIVGLCLLGAAACDGGPGASNTTELSRDDRWIEDVHFLADELGARHVEAFHNVEESQFRSEAVALADAVTGLEDHEIAAGMMRLAASLGDAHTRVDPWSRLDWRRFPLRLQWFDDGIFVVEVIGDGLYDLIGAELMSIGPWTIDDVMEQVSDLVSHENEFWVREQAPDLAMTADVLHALRLLPDRERATFRLRKDGASVDIELASLSRSGTTGWIPALPIGHRPLYLRNGPLFYWYEYLPAERVLYVNYNRCLDMDHLSFAAFAEQVFAVAGQMPVDRFIVDLRHNSGGNSAVMQPLLDGLARRPQLTGDGKLFAMIGGRTFSSGLLNALELRETVGAVLVGAPTGGAPNTYGEVLSFSLPNSGYVVTYSTKYFALLETFENTLFPDFPVPITSTDYFSGHDPVLAFVLP